MNKAELQPPVWLYAIHSKNAELIDLLERYKVPLHRNIQSISTKICEPTLIESIKCHHNDITNYIIDILLDQKNYITDNIVDPANVDLFKRQTKAEIISSCIKYHNYYLIQNNLYEAIQIPKKSFANTMFKMIVISSFVTSIGNSIVSTNLNSFFCNKN